MWELSHYTINQLSATTLFGFTDPRGPKDVMHD